jgi:hypothetical protein
MATKVKSRPAVKKNKARPIAVKAKSKPATASVEPEPLPEAWAIPPATQEECLERIHALGQRVVGYMKYIAKIDEVRGTSSEAKQKAVTAFYDRLLFLEKELGRIQEELQLG